MGKAISKSKNPGLAKMAKSPKGKIAAKKMGFNPDRMVAKKGGSCLLYTSPTPRDGLLSRMPSSA